MEGARNKIWEGSRLRIGGKITGHCLERKRPGYYQTSFVHPSSQEIHIDDIWNHRVEENPPKDSIRNVLQLLCVLVVSKSS